MENKPFKKPNRPSINRPRYIRKPIISDDVNKKQTKKKVTNNKKQKIQKPVEQKLQDVKQPISGSLENKIVEDLKVKSELKPKTVTNKKPKQPRKQKPLKKNDNDNGVFQQMKDKFIGKSKDKDNN